MFSCHTLLSVVTKTPEIAITEKEAELVADAAVKVGRHYNLSASQKALDWANLAICLSALYGPRFYRVTERKKDAARKKNAETMPHIMGG